LIHMMDIIIRERKPITKEIQGILSQCFVNKQNIHSTIDATTTVFCTHKTNVEKCNNILLHKQFSTIEIYQLKIKHKCYKY
jgi:hypothetical protein